MVMQNVRVNRAGMMAAFGVAFALASGGALPFRPAAAQESDAVPAPLVGKLRWATISSMSYRDVYTGAVEGGGGMFVEFTFTRDGRYKMFFYVRQKTYSLVTEATTYSEGTVTFGPNSFTMHSTKGWYRGGSNGANKVKRPFTAEELKKDTVYLYRVEKDANGKPVVKIGPSERSLSIFKPVKE